MNRFDIKGKKAIVTGGTRGLGHGMAEGLLEEGCEVVIVGSSEGVHRVAEEFRSRGFACHGVQADLGSREQTLACFRSCMELLGGEVPRGEGLKGNGNRVAALAVRGDV